MSMGRDMQVKRRVCDSTKLAAVAALSWMTGSAMAKSVCDAVLQYGIFDRSNTLDQRSKFELVRNAHCNSEAKNRATSGGIGYGELFQASGTESQQESRKFCSSSFNEVRQNRYYWNVVSRASATIAGAWLECIKDNRAGASHYIEPTSDPSRFTYKIQYTPDGAPYATKIRSWNITGITSCAERIPHRGQLIDSAGYEIQCFRDPNKTVIVTANVTTGGRNLRRVELPAYQRNISPPPSVKTMIVSGMEFRVVFDGACPDESRAYTGQSDPMGTLLCGETYRVVYTRYNREWVVTGFNESTGASGTWR